MEYYEILGIARDATPREIQKAFRQKAKEVHPDHGGDVKEFVKIQKAYKILSNPLTRVEYDSAESVEFANDPYQYSYDAFWCAKWDFIN